MEQIFTCLEQMRYFAHIDICKGEWIMTKEELTEFLFSVASNKPKNVTRIFFVKKASKYQSFEPQVSSEVQDRILDTVLPSAIQALKSVRIVEYNPIGCADYEAELLESDKVSAFEDILNSIQGERLNKEMKNLDIRRISFYCIKIEHDNHSVLLFRQFSKMTKFRSGFIARIFNDQLVEMENNFLGIDEMTDILYTEGQLFILNHISLERVFNYRDEYLNQTNKAMGELLSQGVILNIEQFSEDCCRDVRIMKRFCNIMTKDRLPLFFENYEKVPGIVTELGLDIEFDSDDKIIYREKSQLFHIISLMSDAYFRTLLSERRGLAKTEEDLPQG